MGPRNITKVSKKVSTHRELEAKMMERTKIFASCSCYQDGLFLFPTRGGISTLGASESGDAPELIVGTSDFPPGREVRMGHLAYRKIGKVTEATSNF